MKLLLNHQIKYLGGYLKPHKKVLVYSLLLSIVSTGLGMIQPFFAKLLIDDVFIGREYRILYPLLALLIFLLILSFIVRMGNSYIYTRYSARLLFQMREDLFRHLHRIPLNFFSKKKIGDIYSRIATDMADIQALMTDTVPHFLFDCLTCLITASILLWLNWKMALMSFCFLPIGLYVIHRIRPKLVHLSREVAEGNADVSHHLFESLGNTGLVRTFGAEKAECAKLQGKQITILDLVLRYRLLGVVSGSVPTAFVVFNAIVVFGYGGFLVMQDAMSIGGLVAFSIYQGRVFAPLQGLMGGFLNMQKSRISLERVRELLDIEPLAMDNGHRILSGETLQGALKFENVSFAYEKENPVLQNLSFQIRPGCITALVGSSGVGKTTICHLLVRLFDPDFGRITLDGEDFKELRSDWLRQQIALVSQDVILFHTTILENIRFSKPTASAEEVVAAAKAAGIHDFILTLPKNYQTEVGDRGVRLSGGQKQRISIARAILLSPKILIMDEATAFLDQTAESSVKKAMKQIMRNRTVLIVSHHMPTIQDADNILTLDENGVSCKDAFTGLVDGALSTNFLSTLKNTNGMNSVDNCLNSLAALPNNTGKS